MEKESRFPNSAGATLPDSGYQHDVQDLSVKSCGYGGKRFRRAARKHENGTSSPKIRINRKDRIMESDDPLASFECCEEPRKYRRLVKFADFDAKTPEESTTSILHKNAIRCGQALKAVRQDILTQHPKESRVNNLGRTGRKMLQRSEIRDCKEQIKWKSCANHGKGLKTSADQRKSLNNRKSGDRGSDVRKGRLRHFLYHQKRQTLDPEDSVGVGEVRISDSAVNHDGSDQAATATTTGANEVQGNFSREMTAAPKQKRLNTTNRSVLRRPQSDLETKRTETVVQEVKNRLHALVQDLAKEASEKLLTHIRSQKDAYSLLPGLEVGTVEEELTEFHSKMLNVFINKQIPASMRDIAEFEKPGDVYFRFFLHEFMENEVQDRSSSLIRTQIHDIDRALKRARRHE